MNDLPYLFGKPHATGDLRSQAADFKVFEIMPFEPCGEGEHVYIKIRKTGVNTVYVARQLAKQLSVKEKQVSYAGLKDKIAICEQMFAVHLPGKQIITASDIDIEGVEVLAIARHNKKLRTGALLGNRFELTLRNVTGAENIEERWQNICQQGVPNYFGEQRFGFEQNNINKALALFAGQKVKDKKKRGLYLSAARSFLFNQFVAHRIKEESFNQLTAGDVCMLAGTQSVFVADQIDDVLVSRLNDFDIDITAPMWGRGELMSQEKINAFEQTLASQYRELADGLENFGLKQERRKIRLTMQSPKLILKDDVLTLSFCLPSGCYATTILRELINYQDVSQQTRNGD